jgi:hypothetical protein
VREQAQPIVLTVVASLILCTISGCGSDDHLVESRHVVTRGGVTADVAVPVGESRSVGTYRVLVTTSDGRSQSFAAERDGMIGDVWLSDLDGDDGLELLVWMSSAGSGSYGSVHVYRADGGVYVPRHIAPLSEEQREGYMGHDLFQVRGGRLVRSFPTYAPGDPNAAPSGDTLSFAYSFADETWTEIARRPGQGQPGR